MSMVPFDHPAWRSPLTKSTAEEILAMRDEFDARVAHVNRQLVEYIEAEKRERDELAQLEEEKV